jgi:hypothetical protein
MEVFANFARTKLKAALSAASTSCFVEDASLIPSDTNNYCCLILSAPSVDGTEVVREVLQGRLVIAETGRITIRRGQQGTTAQDWGSGTVVELCATALTYSALQITAGAWINAGGGMGKRLRIYRGDGTYLDVPGLVSGITEES